MYTFLSIHPLDRHVGCSHVLAIATNAAINMGGTDIVSVATVSFGYIAEVELLDHMVALFLIWGGTSTPFSIVATPICVPTNNV